MWDAKAQSAEFGAFYIEAVQGTGGYVIPPRGYFERLQQTCRERKILIVDDEIQMGFYRTGKFWAIENFGITPDIIVFGKALTNGLNPLSGIWAREELITRNFSPRLHALHFLLEHPGHRRGAGGAEDAGGGGLRKVGE